MDKSDRSKNKLNPKLLTIVETEKRERKKQAVLHEKFQDLPKDTIIIENRAIKTAGQFVGAFLRKVVMAVVVTFAAIGALFLVWPVTRAEVFRFVQLYIIDVLKDYLPFWS